MSPTDLEQYLHEHIPLSKAMAVEVVSLGEEEVVVQAPLLPNINHRETVFGGSASALAILAAWSLLHVRLRGAGVDGRLVIQRNTMEYEAPMAGTFSARSALAPGEEWSKFMRLLARRGKGRVKVVAQVQQGEVIGGRFVGEFVVLSAPAAG